MRIQKNKEGSKWLVRKRVLIWWLTIFEDDLYCESIKYMKYYNNKLKMK